MYLKSLTIWSLRSSRRLSSTSKGFSCSALAIYYNNAVFTQRLWQWWLTHSSFDTYIVVVLRFNTVLQIESNFSVDSLTSCKKYPKPSNTFCLTARSWARWVTNREWLGFRSKLQTCRTLQWWMQICLSLRHPSDTRCVLSNPAPITRDVELSF